MAEPIGDDALASPQRNSALAFMAKLGLVLLVALTLRVIFFSGLISAQTLDDGIYANNVYQVVENGWIPFRDVAATIAAKAPVNPAIIFQLRISYFCLPLAAARLLGYHELSLALPSLIMSLLAVALTALIGRRAGGDEVGLFAAAMLSLQPLDILYATCILPDALFAALGAGTLLAVELAVAERRRSAWLLAGILVGLANVIRPLGVVMGPFLILTVLFFGGPRGIFLALLGFLFGLLPATTVFSLFTGRPFLDMEATRLAHEFCYAHDFANVPVIRLLPIVGVRGVMDYWHSTELLSMNNALLVSVTLALLGARRFAARFRSAWRVCAFFALGLLLLEFAPVGFQRDSHGLVWLLTPKYSRYLVLLLPSLSVLAGFGLAAAFRFHRAAGALAALVAAVMLVMTAKEWHARVRVPVESLRRAADIVLNEPDPVLYTDFLAVGFIRLWVPSEKVTMRSLYELDTTTTMNRALVLHGGPRGLGYALEYVRSIAPAWIRDVDRDHLPGNWTPLIAADDGLLLARIEPSAPARMTRVPARLLSSNAGELEIEWIELGLDTTWAYVAVKPRVAPRLEKGGVSTYLALFNLDGDSTTGYFQPEVGTELHLRAMHDNGRWNYFVDRITETVPINTPVSGVESEGALIMRFPVEYLGASDVFEASASSFRSFQGANEPGASPAGFGVHAIRRAEVK